MQIAFDQLWLLSRIDQSLPQLKSYRYKVNGWQFESKDKRIFVYYKRQWKRIQLKNFSEGMQVAYLTPSKTFTFERNANFLANTLALFRGFDEETGQHYHFLPFFKKGSDFLSSLIDKNQLSAQVLLDKGSTKLLSLQNSFQWPTKQAEKFWFLFSLTLLYGKVDIKNETISSIKLHLPLLWASAQLEENFLSLIQEFQSIGIFITQSIHQQGEKKTMEFSSSDFELIDFFTTRYLNLNLGNLNQSSSPLKSKNQEIKNQLIDFLNSEEGQYLTPELLTQIKDSTLKFLKY